jgi:ribonuclease D
MRRWDLRPLSRNSSTSPPSTAHLTDLYRKLDAELHEKGLEKEAKRLFVGMTAVVWRPRVLDRSAHRKIAGYAQLTSEQKERLRLLCRWRFEKAEELNRACFMLLSDPQLIGLARLENASLQKIAGPGLLSAEGANRFGPEILNLLGIEKGDARKMSPRASTVPGLIDTRRAWSRGSTKQ